MTAVGEHRCPGRQCCGKYQSWLLCISYCLVAPSAEWECNVCLCLSHNVEKFKKKSHILMLMRMIYKI